MERPELAAAAHRYIEAVSRHDMETLLAMFAPGAVQEDPVGQEPRLGIEAIRQFYELGFSSDIRGEITGPVCAVPGAVAFPLAVTFKAGESTLRLEAIDVFEFDEEGRIKHMRAYWGPENCRQV